MSTEFPPDALRRLVRLRLREGWLWFKNGHGYEILVPPDHLPLQKENIDVVVYRDSKGRKLRGHRKASS